MNVIEDYASALCLQVVHQRGGNWLLGEGRSNYCKCTILCNITYIQQYDAENSNTRHLACMIQWKGWRGSCRLKEDQAARPRQPIRLALPFPPGRLGGSLGTLLFILIHIDEVLISCWLTLLSFCYAYSSCCTILFCLL